MPGSGHVPARVPVEVTAGQDVPIAVACQVVQLAVASDAAISSFTVQNMVGDQRAELLALGGTLPGEPGFSQVMTYDEGEVLTGPRIRVHFEWKS